MTDFNELRHENPESEGKFWVNWSLGQNWEFVDDTPLYTKDVVNHFIDQLVIHHRDKMNKTVWFDFTVVDDISATPVDDILERCKHHGSHVSWFAPDDMSDELWESICTYVDHLTVTFDPAKDDPEQFIERINRVAENGVATVRMHTKPLDRAGHKVLRRVAAKLEETSIVLRFPKGYEPNDTEKNQIRILRERYQNLTTNRRTKPRPSARSGMLMIDEEQSTLVEPHEMVANGQNQFMDWSCHAGVEQVHINQYGAGFRGICMQGGRIFRITDEVFDWPTNAFVCEADSCNSVLDLRSTKTWY